MGPSTRPCVPHVVIVRGEAAGLEGEVAWEDYGGGVNGAGSEGRVRRMDVGEEGRTEIRGVPGFFVGVLWRIIGWGEGWPSRKSGKMLVWYVRHGEITSTRVTEGESCGNISPFVTYDATMGGDLLEVGVETKAGPGDEEISDVELKGGVFAFGEGVGGVKGRLYEVQGGKTVGEDGEAGEMEGMEGGVVKSSS